MPPLWPPKREYNAVSAINNEIWQYRTGGNLTIFDKDHDAAEEGRLQTEAFATIATHSWWRPSGIGCVAN